jgi:hypothetical protein
MVRFLKINPKFKGGMIKTMTGLRPLIRRAIRGSGVVRPPTVQFKQLSMSSTVKPAMTGEGVKSKQSYTKLKFLI